MTRSWLLFIAFLAMSAASPASGDLRLEVDPPAPLATTPVTVTVANEFPSTCYQVCQVEHFWVTPTEYQINWSIEERSGGCAQVITTLSSEFALGTLEPGDYLVTAAEHVALRPARCRFASFTADTSTAFRVSEERAVPTVSLGGFMAMTVLVLTAGTVLIHRR
jgi:hypothetical protein